MLPLAYPLELVIGATLERPFTWKAGTPPVPVDLTGYTVEAVLAVNGAAPRRFDSGEIGGIDLDPTAGRLALALSDEVTRTLRQGSGDWSLTAISPSGRRDVLIAGPLASVKVASA